jgi:hypothetical protein
MEDFEKEKGAVCEAATDGCNNYFMNDWKVAWGTLMACEPSFKPEWTCTKFKDNVMTTKMITTTAVETTGMVWSDKDENGCIWSAWYTWSDTKNKCTRSWEVNKLWENDQNFYDTIKSRLDSKYQSIINKGVEKIELKLSKYTSVKADRINKALIDRVETLISQLLMKYPQDIALPAKANNLYLTLTMLKFELMQLSY